MREIDRAESNLLRGMAYAFLFAIPLWAAVIGVAVGWWR
jgi:cell division protein FtsX